MHIHIGHTFFGAGNIGDDLVMGGFLKALSAHGGGLRISCAVPAHALAAQRRRFPEVDWRAYDAVSRSALIEACDVWLGLGGGVLQPSDDGWLLADQALQLQLCKDLDKPAFFLACGVNVRTDQQRPEIRLLLDSARWIWTRDGLSDTSLRGMGAVRTSLGADLSHIVLADLPRTTLEEGSTGFVCILPQADERRAAEVGALVAATQAEGLEPLWLVQEVRPLPGSEEWILSQLPDALAAGLTVRRPPYPDGDLTALTRAWGHPETIFSSRFHGLIIGAWLGSRLLAYEREQKIRGVAEDLGVECLQELPSPAVFRQALNRAQPVSRDRLQGFERTAQASCAAFLAAASASRA